MLLKSVLNLFCFYFSVLISVAAAENSSCIFPDHPEFGQWSLFGQNSSSNPGDSVAPDTILELKCNETYIILDGESISVCIRGKWTSENAKCLKTCPSLHNTFSTRVTCFINERKLNNCVNAVEGTLIKFQCARFYEDQELERNPYSHCYNGTWIGFLPQCVPEYGKKSHRGNEFIVGGRPAEIGEFPWHVALYDVNKTLLCGGTLINQRIILTAAHCITNDDGKLNSKDSYIVAAGKHFLKFNDSRDVNTRQYSTVHKLYIPSNYKADVQNYFGDIGIIVTTKTFFFSETVRPVGLDWRSRVQKSLLDATSGTKYASVSGWGYTVENTNQADVLQTLNVPLINNEDCEKALPREFKKYLTCDKLCAGFLNSSKSVCIGDSGGGLVAEYRNRYYVIGVVSVAPLSETPVGGCDSQQYSLYTKVSDYLSFIYDIEARYKPSSEDNCSLNPSCNTAAPRYTENGGMVFI